MNLLDSGSPYVGYLYSYPHKTSYRALDPPMHLGELWSQVDKRALFLYLHLPFCEMRCGFCNLFTQARPKDESVERYLDSVERQILATQRWLGSVSFARFAVGGGTPTYLGAKQLDRIFTLIERELGPRISNIPASVETSPETAEIDRLEVLRGFGVSRVSIGVQSFDDREVKALARPQQASRVDAALDRIRTLGFPTLNIDLMYGIPEQSTTSWLDTLQRALRFSPEELYLYPLYVRPLTGLGRRGAVSWDEQRLAHYREGRAFLLSQGYLQISMRMFRKQGAPGEVGPLYRCQEDGMIGLGAGARSYTDRVHYSTEYAVGARDVREIIEAFNQRPDYDFAHWGFLLDDEDRRRRWVILSLLAGGIDCDAYLDRFGSEAVSDLPELAELWDRGLADRAGRQIRLTERGVERSDTIGPWLHSRKVEALMRSHQPR